MNWQNHPLIRLIIPFTLGMIGANLFISHMDMKVLFILCCVVLAFSFFFIKTSQLKKDSRFGLVAITLFFLVGMTLYTGKYRHIENGLPNDTTSVQGTLVELPKEKTHSWALKLEQENGVHILLYIGNQPKDLSLGDTISAQVLHMNATNHCEDDSFKTYNSYLFHHGICATAYAPHDRWQVKHRLTSPSILLAAKEQQEDLHHIYDEHGISDEAGSIIEAMTLGRKTTLSSDTRQAYADAGLSHILALSGFHVGIIVLMMQAFFLKSFLPFRWQWVSQLLIIATLWCYALLTGMSPSLVRANIMFTILLLCQFLNREAISINSCAFAFFLMLCLNPFYLHDIGFQLSFMAVGGIALYAQRITQLYCHTHNPILRFLWSLILITSLCALLTAPLVAHHFGRIPLLSLVSNIILIPFVYLLMWTSILWWLFLWCEPINNMLTEVLNWTANTMNAIVEHLSSLPFATIQWQPGVLMTIFCYAVVLVITYFISRKTPAKFSV